MEPILDLIRDSSWQFFFGLAGILVAVIIFLRQRERKRLAYEILLSSPLFSFNAPETLKELGGLEVRFHGRPIDGLSLYAIRISNMGNVPISPDDYVNLLQIRFPDGGKIIGVEVGDASGEILKNDIEKQFGENNVVIRKGVSPAGKADENIHNAVKLPPVLLNTKDWFTVQVIVEEPQVSEPVIDGRIVGVNLIQQISTASYQTLFEFFVMGVLESVLFAMPISIPAPIRERKQ